jgi:radical SAM protein with 4Fe4S-binding SPASM domain
MPTQRGQSIVDGLEEDLGVARMKINDLDSSDATRTRMNNDDIFALTEKAFLKEHAFNVCGTALLAPQLGIERFLDEGELLMVNLLDGTNSVSAIAALLSHKLGISLEDAKKACVGFLARLLPHGLVFRGRGKGREPVRLVPRRTTFSLESVSLVLTHKCNMACVYCYKENNRLEMSSKSVCKILQDILSMGITHVSLTGGEPTLHPRFWDIVNELSHNAIAVTVNTNGSTLSLMDIERLAKAKVVCVCLSIDSLEDEDYRHLGQSRMSASHFLWLIDSLSQLGIQVRTNSALVPGINCSKAKAERLYDVLSKHNVAVQIYSEVIPLGKGAQFFPRPSVFDIAAAIGRKLGIHHSKKAQATPGEGFQPIRKPDNHVAQTSCGVGTTSTFINPDGRVLPCPVMPDLIAGRIDKHRLEDIWESSETLSVFRKKENVESPICHQCPDWEMCKGGCKAKARIYGKSLKSPDFWSCAFFGHVQYAKHKLMTCQRNTSQQHIDSAIS